MKVFILKEGKNTTRVWLSRRRANGGRRQRAQDDQQDHRHRGDQRAADDGGKMIFGRYIDAAIGRRWCWRRSRIGRGAQDRSARRSAAADLRPPPLEGEAFSRASTARRRLWRVPEARRVLSERRGKGSRHSDCSVGAVFQTVPRPQDELAARAQSLVEELERPLPRQLGGRFVITRRRVVVEPCCVPS